MTRRNRDRFGAAFRERLGNGIASLAGWLETILAAVVLVALVTCCRPVVNEMRELFHVGSSELFHEFLASVLNLVIGIEFIEMLTKHSPGSALEVLLFAIVRHMLVGHGTATDNLLSVAAIAIIFVVRKFAFSADFGEDASGEEPAEKVPAETVHE